ncbi:MAG: polysaccharide biosynthesis C-terminal domain-containing protein [Bacteroidetes bacterium]|nr:polysaccharide biosynthesis C-terminal domain-containing protein [Bacteroidota bacterium]
MLGKLRSLASDALIYGLTTILVRFMTFLLTPLYSNYLSKTEIGVFSDLFAVLGFVTIIYCVGLDTSFFRFFNHDDKEGTKKAFSYSFWGIFIVSGFFTAMTFIFADNIAVYFPEINTKFGSSVIRIAAFIPFCDVLTFIPYAVLRMNRRAKTFAGLKIMTVGVNVVATYLLIVVFKMGIMGIVVAGIISSGVALFAFLPIIIRWLAPLRGGKILFREMLTFGLPTVPSSLSLMILQVADRPIMKSIGGAEMLGMYSVNYRLGIPMMLFVAVFEFAWRPFYLTHHEEADAKALFSRILTYFTLCCAVVFLIVCFGMDYIVRLPFVGGRFINPTFWSGMGIIPIIMGGYFFNGLYVNFAAGFHITKSTKFLPIATVVAAASNVLLNILLIPKYGIYGGAWATFGAYFLSMIVLYYYARKVYPIPYEWKRIFLIIGVTLGIFWGVNFFPDTIWTKILAIVTLLAFFRFTGFLTAEEIGALKRLLRRKPKV